MQLPDITVQEAHLQLIRRSDGFDGERVAQELLTYRALWVGALATHSQPKHAALYLVEEIPEDRWHADTLWLMTRDGRAAAKLADLCRLRWKARTVQVYARIEAERLLGLPLHDDEVLLSAVWG